MTKKRIFDLLVASLALVALVPLMLLISIWIKLDSKGPIIFRQERVGKNGEAFEILKFRTMNFNDVSQGPLLTRTDDTRVTSSGRLIRKFKLDELPQFVNVVWGEMSVVGPRPEVRKYVDLYSDDARRKILSVRPGITDNASVRFRNEGDILAEAGDPEREYVDNILPEKVSLYIEYVDNQSLIEDLRIIGRTLRAVIVW